MKYLTLILFLIASNLSTSQSITKIIFNNQMNFNDATIEGIPEGFKAEVIKQKNSEILITNMYFNQDGEVWYESDRNQDNELKEKLLKYINLNNTKDIIDIPIIRIQKNFRTKTCFQLEHSQIVKTEFANVNWLITDETKTILGYKCSKATAMNGLKPIFIFFTTQIKGKASTGVMSAIDGVVLEYNVGLKTGIATKIEFNQPDIKDFFK